jgi:MoxR-like ATPase
MVLATQNPIDQEGTYTLPEAQLDRFLLKVRVTTRRRPRSARCWMPWPPPRRSSM